MYKKNPSWNVYKKIFLGMYKKKSSLECIPHMYSKKDLLFVGKQTNKTG